MTLLFVLLQLPLNAQQGFINAYNFGYPTPVVLNAMLLDESDLIICGYLQDSISPHQQGVIFTKIDTTGAILTFKTHFDSLGYNLARGNRFTEGGLIKLQDTSGYLFIGSVIEGAMGFMMKLDTEGDLIWSKYLEDTVSLQGRYTKLLETETGFLIGGTKQNSLDGENDMFLIKTDKEGNFMWEKSYGALLQSDILHTLLVINGNEYVLGSTKRSIAAINGSQIKIFGVDSLGIEQWNKETNTPSVGDDAENVGCLGLHQDEEGNWVYVTSRFQEQTSGSRYAQAQFVVRDGSFNLLTERVYDDFDGQTNNFYNLVQLSDGDWLGLGSNGEPVLPPGTVLGHNYAWMARISSGQDGISSSGDSLWTRLDLTFPDSLYPSIQYIHSAIELPSGSIIAAGYFDSFVQGQVSHGLLIKVNQHGCLSSTSCTPTNLPNADTIVYLQTCDPTEVSSLQYTYPGQNGNDSIVATITSLIPAPDTPIAPSNQVLEMNAPPFQLNIGPVDGAVSYEWTVPQGVEILWGADSTTVSIQWNDQVTNGLVCVSAVNECGSSPAACTEVTVDFTDGLSEVNKKSYSVFPNPVDEVLHIVFEEEGRYEIVLLDVLGRVVVMTSADSKKGDVITSSLEQGVYWLKIVKGGAVFWEQVEVLR